MREWCPVCAAWREPHNHEPSLWDAVEKMHEDLIAKPASELARTNDPETSHAAARALGGKAGTMRRTLLDVYSCADLIAEEASEEAGYTAADGAWKRVSDLLGAGLLEDTGQTRLASTGRSQRVLRITQAGREALK